MEAEYSAPPPSTPAMAGTSKQGAAENVVIDENVVSQEMVGVEVVGNKTVVGIKGKGAVDANGHRW